MKSEIVRSVDDIRLLKTVKTQADSSKLQKSFSILSEIYTWWVATVHAEFPGTIPLNVSGRQAVLESYFL